MITVNKIRSSTITRNLGLINGHSGRNNNKINAEHLTLLGSEMINFLEESKGYTFEVVGSGYVGPDFFRFFEIDQLEIVDDRIDFIETCNAYYPDGIFCYSLRHKKYALYDYTHRELFLISTMNFDLFRENPALYINAQWRPTPMRAHGIILMPENMVHNYWGEVLINDQKNPFLFSAGKSASKFDLIISNRFGQELEEENVLLPSNLLREDFFEDTKGNLIKGFVYQLDQVTLQEALIENVELFVVQDPTVRISSIFGLSILGKAQKWDFSQHPDCLHVF